MKAFKYWTSAIMMLLICSCTKIIYTHQQVMDSYHTKKDVVSQFGLPTEKRVGEGIEEWIYDHGTVTTGREVNTSGRVNIGVAQFNTYTRYIKFTFDKDGNVTKWDSQGIDLTQRKVQKGKSLALSVVLGVAIGLIIAGTSNN